MAEQTHFGNPQNIIILLEIVPEDERDVDPIAMDQVGGSLLNTLSKAGYSIKPAYTGERGGSLYEILTFLEAAYQTVISNKDLFVEMFKTARPVGKLLVEEGEKRLTKGTAQGPIKIEIGIGGDYIKAEANDFAGDEKIVKLANKFLMMHPHIVEQRTSQNIVRVRGSVSKRRVRRRK